MPIALPPHEPLRTGGGGTIIEVLLALTTAASAALAALVVARAPKGQAKPPSAEEPHGEGGEESD